jgi:hypothetical protein
VRSCSSREILRVLPVLNSTWSFSSCSVSSFSLLIFFLLSSSMAYKVPDSNLRFMGTIMNDRFLHFGYFSIVIGSLKPSDSFFFISKPAASSLV